MPIPMPIPMSGLYSLLLNESFQKYLDAEITMDTMC